MSDKKFGIQTITNRIRNVNDLIEYLPDDTDTEEYTELVIKRSILENMLLQFTAEKDTSKAIRIRAEAEQVCNECLQLALQAEKRHRYEIEEGTRVSASSNDVHSTGGRGI